MDTERRQRPSDTETSELLAVVRRGPAGSSAVMAAEAALVEGHHGLVVTIVNRMRISGDDRDDALSEGSIGLLMAVRGYDPGRGVPFWGYAGRRIEWAIDNGLNLTCQHRGDCRHRASTASLDAPPRQASDGDDDLTIGALMADPVDGYRAVDDRVAVERYLGILTTLQREAVELRYGVGSRAGRAPMTMDEVGAVLGITRQAVERRERGAMERMRARGR